MNKISNILNAFHIEGNIQVHSPSLLITPDIRATQIFLNIASYKDDLKNFLKNRYLPETEVLLLSFRNGEILKQQIKLEDIVSHASSDNQHLLIEPQDTEHPGGLYGLVHITDRLLAPGGCPWDQAQTHESLKKNLIEEAYEVIDAIDSQSDTQLIEELGDLLLQPMLHSQIEKSHGNWDIDVVANKLIEKIIRRHPHVFGSAEAKNVEEALAHWNEVKRLERGEREKSLLEDIPRSLPALFRALKISQKCANEGFEWRNIGEVFKKFHEEVEELQAAHRDESHDRVESEVGDLLFTVVQIARWLGIDPEEALRKMLERFIRRFEHMENHATKPLHDLSPEDWEELWVQAKEKLEKA